MNRAASEPLMTTEDVCTRFGVERTTIYRWVRAGRFPPPLRLAHTRLVRWRVEEVQAFEDRLAAARARR